MIDSIEKELDKIEENLNILKTKLKENQEKL